MMASTVRSASLRLPLRSVSRVASTARILPAVRANSSTSAAVHGNENQVAQEQGGEMVERTVLNRDMHGVKMERLVHDKIPHGVDAFVVMPGYYADNAFNASRKAVEDHARETTELWRRLSYYVALPACLVTGIWVYLGEKEHADHRQALISSDANGGEPPERKVYSYMNIRTKPFPWGNQTLFFNPDVNIKAEEA
ncbi:cytochrome c oxidase subunit VIa-domain-containing protein [Kockovaella imperatae]|uniref:Cytochrome c oxidase subunit 13, mitochondrial n=1 Tax=Kockovaella imperatae TaxID=4999 RepID=A0A1Y1UAQ7_9TREE|nr:cytochrome c oxidase subunit VIa-domain-containing protein [Kockovaella imperatae]ORX34165.1 cytochrome c oxidase subunit VIa-domain-containing protein [Kockovaella imperatae]